MTVTIKYKARMSWREKGITYTDVLCNVIHEVDTETLQTKSLKWAPFPEEPE
jgi:hypothetical protein